MSQNVQSRKYVLLLLRGSLYLLVNIMLVIVIIYGTFYMCRSGYNFCYGIFGPVVVEEPPGSDKEFEVRDSDDMFDVATRLKEDNIITDNYAFYIRTNLWIQTNYIKNRGVHPEYKHGL